MFDDCNHIIAHSGNSERNINKICVCIMVKQTKYIKVFYGKNYIYIYIYISGLARPQGRPKKKKILRKIYLKALKDRYGCQDTIISKCIFFHMLEIRGSHRAIVTKLNQPLVLMASLFCQSLNIFGPVEPEI